MIFIYTLSLQKLEALGFTLRPGDWRRLFADYCEEYYVRLTFADAASYEAARAKLIEAKVQIVHERAPQEAMTHG